MKPINRIKRKLCQAVGVDWKTVDFHKDGWYLEHTWTQEQEDEFKEWLADYLYKNTRARQQIMKFPRKDKRICARVASGFVWNHGWKAMLKENNGYADIYPGTMSE